MRIDDALIAERARYVHSNMLPIIFANFIGGATTAVFFRDVAKPLYFLIWVGLFGLMTLYWLVMYWKLRGAEWTPQTAQRLFRLVLYGGLTVSLAWGVGFYFFYPVSSPAQQSAMFSSVMLFGVSSAICFASYYPAFLGTFLPFALSAIFILVIQPVIFYPRLITICVFAPMMTLFAWRLNRLLIRSLQLRFENLDLVAQLTTQKELAEQANRAKSVFLAKISHELRTPMHAVLGYVDLALRENIGPVAARHLNTARMAGQQLVSQINDLLDYARIEHALLKLEPSSTALHGLAAHIKERVSLLAQEHGNHFELVLAPDLPHWIWIDGGRLEQVLMALLNNAVRYTRSGRICLRIGVTTPALPGVPADTSTLALRFEVEDTGRGIAPEALTRIFQAFERGASGDADGMGLGLPIAQQLLGLMGSRLEVTSQLGSGSCFGFTLAVQRSNESHAMQTPQSELFTGYQGRTRQVLILDDNPVNRRYLEELLGDLGFDTCTFAGVAAAMSYLALLDLSSASCPDLCIVDQHLNEHETGWDFMRALRSASGLAPQIRDCPALMLSATEALPPLGWDVAHDIDRHLLKPVQQQVLLQTMGEMMGLEWSSPARTEQAVDAGAPALPEATVAARAWEQLIEAADSGGLSALEDWLLEYPALESADSQFQRLVQTLDFAGLGAYAKSRLQALPSRLSFP